MVDNRYTGVGYEPPFETPSDKDFMAAYIDSLQTRVAELKSERDQLKAENERLRKALENIGKHLNLIFIELYGFAGAVIHENGLKTLKSLRAFLDDTDGLSDTYIAGELKRNGIDPETLVKRGLDMIEKAKSNAALEVDGGKI